MLISNEYKWVFTSSPANICRGCRKRAASSSGLSGRHSFAGSNFTSLGPPRSAESADGLALLLLPPDSFFLVSVESEVVVEVVAVEVADDGAVVALVVVAEVPLLRLLLSCKPFLRALLLAFFCSDSLRLSVRLS